MTAGRRLLLGVSGSIGAASLLPVYASLKDDLGFEVATIMTPDAARIVGRSVICAVTRGTVVLDEHGDASADLPSPHVDLARWCDALVVLPASARTLSAAAAGDGANLLQLALLNCDKPTGFVPVMNQVMWSRPAVQRNVQRLRDDGHAVLLPADVTHLGRSAAGGDGLTYSPGQIRRFVRDLVGDPSSRQVTGNPERLQAT